MAWHQELPEYVDKRKTEVCQVTKIMCDLSLSPLTALLIPAVFKSQAWGVLYALLEIISFRVHLQLQFSYRFQLLQQLHTVANVSIIPSQLFIR